MRANLLFFLLFGLISTIIACPVAVRNVCACQNDQEGVVLQCVGQPMSELVQLLLVNQAQLGLIKQLTIQQSPPLANLTAKFFDGLYIKKLIVQDSGIERVDAHAFDGLANTIQDLNLAHNNIKEMPSDALNKLSSLLSLDFSNNSISDLTAKHVLPTLPKVSILFQHILTPFLVVRNKSGSEQNRRRTQKLFRRRQEQHPVDKFGPQRIKNCSGIR
jgi:hypothetical protein